MYYFATGGKSTVYFVDATHFVLMPYFWYLWSLCRLLVKAPSGRNRLNVLGTLEAISHQVITVTNELYINSLTVCELLWMLREMQPDQPIKVVLDNARYHKCKWVTECAEMLKIQLIYLRPYSPNLNLIERLWKFVKKKSLYSKYYSEFVAFKKAITDCLSNTQSLYRRELDWLLTLNFQSFNKTKNVRIITA